MVEFLAAGDVEAQAPQIALDMGADLLARGVADEGQLRRERGQRTVVARAAALGKEEDEILLEQLEALEPVHILERIADDRDVEVAIEKCCRMMLGIARPQRELPGVVPELGAESRREIGEEGVDGANTDARELERGRFPHRRDDLSRLADERLRPLLQGDPGGGQGQGAQLAIDELDPEGILELADHLGDRGLRKPEAHGSTRHAARLGHGEEDFKGPEVEGKRTRGKTGSVFLQSLAPGLFPEYYK